ncbi:MAG: PEP-CTERM sorting domain-containing protein [Planctomycetota bacterium]
MIRLPHSDSFRHLPLVSFAVAGGLLTSVAMGQSTVVIFDGFGDADRNNDGQVDNFDLDASSNGVLEPYTPPNFPDVTIDEILPTNPLIDPTDTGIRWLGAGGFTSSPNGDTGLFDEKIFGRIIDDSAGVAPEGVSIDSGLALGLNSKGRGTTVTGFFGQNVALGTNVGDQVKVSYDIRLWDSSPNGNSPATPDLADLRFGLYQDTDGQIGQTSSFSGPNFTAAVWGEDDGTFDGQFVGPGARDDHGWGARIKIGPGYPSDGADAATPSGSMTGPRIFEETNDPDPSSTNRQRILQGSDDDFVAAPDDVNPNFTTMLQGKVYNFALTLERTEESILATYDVMNITDGTSFSFGGEESLNDGATDPGSGGIQSESWDYFALRISSANSFNETDYDLVLDNFMLETIAASVGMGIVGDYDEDGQVAQGDLNLVLNNWGAARTFEDPGGTVFSTANVDQEELNGVLNNWGAQAAPSFEGAAVPEPATFAALGGLALLGLRRRRA